MKHAAVALGGLVAFGVALVTVATRTEIVREGYRQARLEQRIETEQARLAVLEAEYARRTTPRELRRLTALHGLELVPAPPAPSRSAPSDDETPDGPTPDGPIPDADAPGAPRPEAGPAEPEPTDHPALLAHGRRAARRGGVR